MASPEYSLARRSDVTHTGDMTWYDVGVGSCGQVSSPGDHVVALSPAHMGSDPNPNLSSMCGSTITIEFEGQSVQATVLDTCPSCEANAIDCSSSLFQAVAPNGDGRVVVDWRFNDDGESSPAPDADSEPATVVPDEAQVQPPMPVIAAPGPVVASLPYFTSEPSTFESSATELSTELSTTESFSAN